MLKKFENTVEKFSGCSKNPPLYKNLRGLLKVERIVNKAKAIYSINKSPIQIIIGIVDERLVKQ